VIRVRPQELSLPGATDVDFVVDPDASQINVTVDNDSAPGDAKAVIMLSRPLPVGRQPAPNTLRVIAAVDLASSSNLASAYVARFGRLPAVGCKLMARVRVASPGDRSAGSFTEAVAIAGEAAAAASCSVSPDPIELYEWDGVGIDVEADHANSGDTTSWDVELDNERFVIDPAGGFPSGVAEPTTLYDYEGGLGTFTVLFTFTSTDTVSVICSVSVVIDVVEMP